MREKIKSCPFCGEIAECAASAKQNEELMYKVECSSCFGRTDFYDHPDIAISKWNVRLRLLEDEAKSEELPVIEFPSLD